MARRNVGTWTDNTRGTSQILYYITKSNVREHRLTIEMDETISRYLTEVAKVELSSSDPCVFYKRKNGRVVFILGVYVDDTLIFWN
jgi:hypothetical protein